jgi:hypothetical protein
MLAQKTEGTQKYFKNLKKEKGSLICFDYLD